MKSFPNGSWISMGDGVWFSSESVTWLIETLHLWVGVGFMPGSKNQNFFEKLIKSYEVEG